MIRSSLYYPILIALLFSCSDQASNPKEEPSKEIEAQKGTISTVDTIAVSDHSIPPKRNVDSLLLNPFDHVAYKRKKRGANSGGGGSEPYFFRPDTAGMYYRYFLFHIPHEKKYLGKDTSNRVSNGPSNSGGREITVFKPDDADKNMYDDPNEVLIEFTQWINDTDLPELAYVGWTKKEIQEEFGQPDFEKNNAILYTFQNRILLFKIFNGSVKWLKYVHAREPFQDTPTFQMIFKKNVFGM
ncbi:MAG: hypothetical protein Crog4KO_18120 [Crocinitomicaceae bacterium]